MRKNPGVRWVLGRPAAILDRVGLSEPLPRVVLVRHGATEWSTAGRHTGRTDLPLTPQGEAEARRLRGRLEGLTTAQVWSSPLQRARRTCELAGYGDRLLLDDELVEWDYGEYEGLQTAEIRQRRPGWLLFRDGCPGGESVDAVCRRADRLVQRMRGVGGDLLVFSHGHLLRLLAARWLGFPALEARRFLLNAGAVSMLGYEHSSLDEPALLLWNDVG